MNTVLTRFCCGLLLVSCGCTKSEGTPSIAEDSYTYVKIGFTDANGADKVKGIECVTSLDELVGQRAYSFTKPVVQTHWNDCAMGALRVDEQPDQSYLVLTLVLRSAPIDFDLKSFETSLTCPHIFGDNEPHPIAVRLDKKHLHSAVCSSVEFNGKTFSSLQKTYPGGGGVLPTPDWIATVVLD